MASPHFDHATAQLRDNEPDSPIDTLAHAITILTAILLAAPAQPKAAPRDRGVDTPVHRCSAGARPETVERVSPADTGHPEERSDEGSPSSLESTAKPTAILTGSSSRALCKLASLASLWCDLITNGHRPKHPGSKQQPVAAFLSPVEGGGAASPQHPNPDLPPTDPSLLAPWLHTLKRRIMARIQSHFAEALTAARESARPISDADNRLLNLMLRLDPPPSRFARPNTSHPNLPAPNLPTTGHLPSADELMRRAFGGQSLSDDEIILGAIDGILTQRANFFEAQLAPSHSTTPAPKQNPSAKQTPAPTPKPATPKPPQKHNPSKQYKLRRSKPAPNPTPQQLSTAA